MVTEGLRSLHNRYVQLSNRFRAALAFNQFIAKVAKVSKLRDLKTKDIELRNIYDSLKKLSSEITTGDPGELGLELNRIERELQSIYFALLSQDNKVTPAVIRQFFQRLRSKDSNFILQLVKFYVYSLRFSPWNTDKCDKIDYLITEVSIDHSSGLPFVLKPPSQLMGVFKGIWKLTAFLPPSDEEVVAVKSELEKYAKDLDKIKSFDEFVDSGILKRYRELKHSLVEKFFYPDILLEIVSTNVAFKNQIIKLYRREERTILSECEELLKLEERVRLDNALVEELNKFHREVEKFEKGLNDTSFSIDEIAKLVKKLRDLKEKVNIHLSNVNNINNKESEEVSYTFEQQGEETRWVSEDHVFEREEETVPSGYAVNRDESSIIDRFALPEDPSLKIYVKRMVTDIWEVDKDVPARAIAYSRELLFYGFRPVEIEAFRKVRDRAENDLEIYNFILWCAALRAKIKDDLDKVKQLGDESIVDKNDPVIREAQVTAKLAQKYLKLFEFHLEANSHTFDGSVKELYLLYVKLMHVFSELWIAVNET